MTRAELMLDPCVSAGVDSGKIEILESECFRCHGSRVVPTERSCGMLDSMFFSMGYGTAEFSRVERSLPNEICPHCGGTGRESFPVLVQSPSVG